MFNWTMDKLLTLFTVFGQQTVIFQHLFENYSQSNGKSAVSDMMYVAIMLTLPSTRLSPSNKLQLEPKKKTVTLFDTSGCDK